MRAPRPDRRAGTSRPTPRSRLRRVDGRPRDVASTGPRTRRPGRDRAGTGRCRRRRSTRSPSSRSHVSASARSGRVEHSRCERPAHRRAEHRRRRGSVPGRRPAVGRSAPPGGARPSRDTRRSTAGTSWRPARASSMRYSGLPAADCLSRASVASLAAAAGSSLEQQLLGERVVDRCQLDRRRRQAVPTHRGGGSSRRTGVAPGMRQSDIEQAAATPRRASARPR